MFIKIYLINIKNNCTFNNEGFILMFNTNIKNNHMRSDPEIVILVEHISRELSIACILKIILEKKFKRSVHIQSVSDTSNLNKIKPKLLLTPFFRSLNSDVFPFVYKWSDAKIINLCYEQVFRSHQLKFREPKGDFTKDKVTHICWGEKFKDFLISNGVKNNNIKVNGNLQYQLYKKPYNEIYFNKEYLSKKYNLSKNKKWILFPENYGAIFGGDKAVSNPVDADKIMSEKVKIFVEKSFNKTMKWIDEYSNLNDVEIIIRPRPMTPKSNLLKAYTNINGIISENVHFIKEEKAKDWILSSDVIISNYSTTLIESSLADKETYMLEPFEFPEFMTSDWYEFIPKLKSFDDFNSIPINNVSNTKDLKKWTADNISPNLDVIDGLSYYLFDELQTFTPQYNEISKYYINDMVEIPKPEGLVYHTKKIIKNILKKSNTLKFYKKKYHLHHEISEFDEITDNKINDEINRWDQLVGSK